MKINRVHSSHVAVATGVNRTGSTKEEGRGRSAGAARDEVQLSSAGRELSAARSRGDRLSAERIGEVRQRISDGFYDQPEIAEEVAVRMLERGDV